MTPVEVAGAVLEGRNVPLLVTDLKNLLVWNLRVTCYCYCLFQLPLNM